MYLKFIRHSRAIEADQTRQPSVKRAAKGYRISPRPRYYSKILARCPESKVRRSFARGSLADWAGWLPAREFASRSGAMNLEQVGPLDIHLLCRFGARPPFPPRSPSCSHSCCIFRFLRVRSPLPHPPLPPSSSSTSSFRPA